MPSQMNPLAKVMLAEFRSVEIQARLAETPAQRSTRQYSGEEHHAPTSHPAGRTYASAKVALRRNAQGYCKQFQRVQGGARRRRPYGALESMAARARDRQGDLGFDSRDDRQRITPRQCAPDRDPCGGRTV